MNTTQPTARRRRHPPEYKRQLVAQCQPGVSTSAVALAHGVNTTLLRRWIKQYSGELPTQVIAAAPAKLVAVQVDSPGIAGVGLTELEMPVSIYTYFLNGY